MIDPIALAVPVFFVFIAIELIWAKRRGVRVYRFADAITDLSCGITSQLVLLVWAATLLAAYALVYDHFRIVTFDRAWIPWMIAFFAVDFFYYWWHRLSHEVNVLWAAHVVHHQSEDYNLAVALRQAVLTSWTALPFYLPLAVLGVPTHVYAIVHALSTLYQFWIHTELVGKVGGPIGLVLNLPSHHRVHHAVNGPYLDRNYGATLIVWDRLFGTYAEEKERPVYGLTTPLGTFDPIWAQVHYWYDMARMMRAARRPKDKLRVLIASPAWKPEGYVPRDVGDPLTRPKYDRTISSRLAAYVGAHYAVVIVATFAIMMWHSAMPRGAVVSASVAVVASLIAFGALIEGRRWARAFEGVRLAACGVALVAVATSGCRRKQDEVRVVTIEGESAVLPARGAAAKPPAMRAEPRTSVVDGATRKWLLVEPRNIEPAERLALVLVFHGDGGNAQGFHIGFPFERASGDSAILAYLDGVRTTWDLETKQGQNRDVRFAKAVVDALISERSIDRDRIFAAGYSSGGFFANVLACHEPGLLRAISSSAGGAPYHQAEKWPNGFPKCPGQKPTAAIALHGERDFAVTIDSGRFSAAYWAYVNGCNTGEMETTDYKECRAYRGCPASLGVAWCDVPSLDHWVWEHAAEASWTFFEQVTAAR